MEQREVVHRYYVLGTNTLDKVLKVLFNLSSDGVLALKDKFLPLKGGNNLYKLMNREDPLTSARLHEGANLNKLKRQLETQGLPFTFKETKEGTDFYFRVKNTGPAEKVLERVLTDIKKNPQMILCELNTMTFDKWLTYTAANKKYVGKIDQTKVITKGRKLWCRRTRKS